MFGERGTSYFVLLTLQYGSDQSKESEMGGACSMHVKCDKHIQNLGREYKTKNILGDLGYREQNVRTRRNDLDWIHFAEFKVQRTI